MSESNRMVNYYEEHEISPVKQNLGDLDGLIARRSALLSQLCMNQTFFRNRRLIEVGPGSGHNSLYFAALDPSDYTMVEPNSSGVKDIRSNFPIYHPHFKQLSIHQVFLEEFVSSNKMLFDVVWCENMLGGVSNPTAALSDLGKLVTPGGSLIITTMDEVCTFAETVRRLLCYAALDKAPKSPEDTDILVPFLSKHLSNLKGMNRLHRDWVHDNIALPITSGYNILSLPLALNHLDNDFIFVSSSPRFYTDWRWYKNIPFSEESFNQLAIREFNRNLHTLIDYRFNYPSLDEQRTLSLKQLCQEFRLTVESLENDWNSESLLCAREILKNIVQVVSEVAPRSRAALEEALTSFDKIRGNPSLLGEMTHFSEFFGKNQQHIHLVRKSPEVVLKQHERRNS